MIELGPKEYFLKTKTHILVQQKRRKRKYYMIVIDQTLCHMYNILTYLVLLVLGTNSRDKLYTYKKTQGYQRLFCTM